LKLPSRLQLLSQDPQDELQLSLSHPLLEAAVAGLVRRVFLGSSRHCAPVPKTQRIPLRTARVSCHGRPRPSERRLGRKIGSISCHWASLSSHRPRIHSLCPLPAAQKITNTVQPPFMRLALVSSRNIPNLFWYKCFYAPVIVVGSTSSGFARVVFDNLPSPRTNPRFGINLLVLE